jgi:TonB-dependent SusC/RagA subfamily outer membrane receptor
VIAAWMLYCTLLAALIGAAARAAEYGLRVYRLPARLVWAVMMCVSVAFPFMALVFPSSAPGVPADTAVAAATSPTVATVPVGLYETFSSVGSALEALDVPLMVGWTMLSATLLVLLLWSSGRLVKERRSWQWARLGDRPVLLSRDTGPAVVGFFGSSIVIPNWVLEAERELQQVISRHEEQHVRAGDLRLWLSFLVVNVLVPWNVALWWQLRRLSLAIEADCDARVLARGVDVHQYGSLLLEVRRRANSRPLPALAFTRTKSALAWRVHLMTWNPRNRIGRALSAAAATGALALLACETPLPEQPELGPPESTAVRQQTVGEGAVLDVAKPLELDEGTVLDVTKPLGLDEGAVLDVAMPLELVEGEIVGSQTPVIYVDGIRFHAESLETVVADGGRRGLRLPHMQISPDAIESIEVIKGAQAKALYGEKAANGVVTITTRDTSAIRDTIANQSDETPLEVVVPEATPKEPLTEALSRDPLVLIDGEMVGREAVEALDPKDIESVEIIKGPAAEALYGQRAANGVISITTRRKQ